MMAPSAIPDSAPAALSQAGLALAYAVVRDQEARDLAARLGPHGVERLAVAQLVGLTLGAPVALSDALAVDVGELGEGLDGPELVSAAAICVWVVFIYAWRRRDLPEHASAALRAAIERVERLQFAPVVELIGGIFGDAADWRAWAPEAARMWGHL